MPNAECGMGRPGDKESASIAEPGRRRNGVGGQTHARRKLVPPWISFHVRLRPASERGRPPCRAADTLRGWFQ